MNERDLRILRSIANELRALRQEIRSIYDERKTADSTESNKPVRPVPIELRQDSITESSVREYYAAENKERKSRWRRLKPWIETSGIIVALALAGFSLWTVLEIRKQTPAVIKSANAAKNAAMAAGDQVNLMRQQLETQAANVIPRIYVQPDGPPDGAQWPKAVLVNPVNAGPTAASNVHFVLAVNLIPMHGESVIKTLRKIDQIIPNLRGQSMIPAIDQGFPPVGLSYPFSLSSQEKLWITSANARIVIEGTMSYYTFDPKSVVERPICITYWSYWFKDRRSQGRYRNAGGSMECPQFNLASVLEDVQTAKQNQETK
jgi:hypothetical protein